MNHRAREGAVTGYCVRTIGGARQLPGRCADCGQRLLLVLPYGWREVGGRAHHCR